jgi:hypothetical protein
VTDPPLDERRGHLTPLPPSATLAGTPPGAPTMARLLVLALLLAAGCSRATPSTLQLKPLDPATQSSGKVGRPAVD